MLVVAHLAAQATPPAQTPAAAPQTPAPQGGQPAAGRGQGQGRGRGPGTFPAQQRPPGDQALIEKGKGLYTVNCSACHGVDLRGGTTGGPNLLRSAVVLNDKAGELILPIVRGARAERGMPALPLSDDDVKAVAEFVHSILATARGQGAPPPTDIPPPNIVVGDAAAGQTYFAAKCSSCHSASGDLQGIATRVGDAKALQNLWVSGGMVGGRGRGAGAGGNARAVTATVTMPSGEKAQGRLVQIDHFIVTLALEDGTLRSFRRDGDRPKVDVNDPLAAHKALLAVYTEKDMHDLTAYLVTLK
jgi:cytochrome c oxidase cbb3-type subunit 3